MKKFFCLLEVNISMLEVYIWMIIIRIVASWLVSSMSHPMVRLWALVTDPALGCLEKVIPPVMSKGIYYYDLPILGILLAMVFGKHLFNSLTEA